ncbi:MAG: hypothetical protein IJ875_06675 [Solobacterium sp.]|nr:hypothetical protein [Solobacterium sp.]
MEKIKSIMQEIKNMPLMYLSMICFGGMLIIGDFIKESFIRFLIQLFMLIVGLISLGIQFKLIAKAEKRNHDQKKQFWTIQLDNNEYDIKHPDDFLIHFDHALTDLEMGELPFIVLSPPTSINGIVFLQVAQNENFLMHVEAGIIESPKSDNVKILYKDDISTGDVLHIFHLFFSEGKIDLSNWKE